MSRLNMSKTVWMGLHPGYGLLSLVYMAAIYSVSFVPNIGLEGRDPLVSLASNLLHIPLYAGLTFCVRQAVAEGDARLRRPVLSILVFVAAATYAALDEWHQSFVPGRNASMADFLLDIVGSGAMLLFLQNDSRPERIFNRMSKLVRSIRGQRQICPAARAEQRRDRLGLPTRGPSVERAVEEAVNWLAGAQDRSRSQDGGVARHYSLLTGWSTSYPETTGYIIPSILAYARLRQNQALRQRAKTMLDWLVSLQRPEGSFQGGLVDSAPLVPVAFNTGQILLGLASGVREFGDEYRLAMCRAADWLVEVQDRDGSWRTHSSPFAAPGPKAYHTHIAWGLLEAARIEGKKPYGHAALANVQWALGLQRENGWFDKCCLSDDSKPLTHTLGYALRGAIEAYRFAENAAVFEACQKTADGLLRALRADGFLPGRLRPDWSGAVSWACLTGSLQIAHCWLLLFQHTGDMRYRQAAWAVNRYVRRTVNLDGAPEIRGGIKGSFPVDGEYGRYEYLNWAAKFFIDSNLLEIASRDLLSY